MSDRSKTETAASTGRLLKDALRLTRDGRLGEATALLRDGLGLAAARPAPAPSPGNRGPAGRPWTDALRPPSPEPAAFPGNRAPARERAAPPAPGSFTGHVAGNAHGTRAFKLYLPKPGAGRRGAPLPLVVMLHGCTQSPDDFAAGTRMNDLADELGFLVAYPEQNRAANASKCWNWFRPGDQRRGAGEPSLVAAMVEQVATIVAAGDCRMDPARVFVAGLSAGGAAAAVLARTYPELFAGVGVHSGLACGAARDLSSALAAMRSGAPGAPADPGARPTPAIVFHGTADRTVSPLNAGHVAAAAVAGAAAPQVSRGRSPGGVGFERAVHRQGRRVVAEVWTLEGVGHAWSGGSPAGSYTEPRGPDASRAMMRFFLGLKG